MSAHKQAKRKASGKKAKLELPDVDAVFVTYHDAQALVTAAYHVMDQPDHEKLWMALAVLRKGVEAIGRLGKQLDEVDKQLMPFREKYEAASEDGR